MEVSKCSTRHGLELHKERADFGICGESSDELVDVERPVLVRVDLFENGVDDAVDHFELFVVHARRRCCCIRIVDLPLLFGVFKEKMVMHVGMCSIVLWMKK